MNYTRNRGFTLIELMIVVVIVGILGAIAYPSYKEHVVKGRRAAAQGYMLSLASREEQMLLDNRAYRGAADNAALAVPGLISVPNDVAAHYNFSVAVDNAATPPTFLITAVPFSSMMMADGNLTLNSVGVKGPAGKW